MQYMMMNREMRRLLRVLGFAGDLEGIPPLQVIRNQFRKKCLLKHPDKPTGDKEDFQELLDAYTKIVKHVKAAQNVDEDETEVEDEEASERKYCFIWKLRNIF
jgi:hypothetical protein